MIVFLYAALSCFFQTHFALKRKMAAKFSHNANAYRRRRLNDLLLIKMIAVDFLGRMPFLVPILDNAYPLLQLVIKPGFILLMVTKPGFYLHHVKVADQNPARCCLLEVIR